MVATREGGVDRNTLNIKCIGETAVATREGGVDRNVEIALTAEKKRRVATREGGVDRNSMALLRLANPCQSPPARVAWIETDFHR